MRGNKVFSMHLSGGLPYFKNTIQGQILAINLLQRPNVKKLY